MTVNSVDGDDEVVGGDPLFLFLIVLFIILIVVTIGTIGYRIFAELEWIDAFHNGAMVFTSTTLAKPVQTYNGKIFSAFYNIMSGIFVLVIIGVIVRRALRESDISNTAIDSNCNCCDHSDDDDRSDSSVFDY